MKYGNTNYVQRSRELTNGNDGENLFMSDAAFKLYDWLVELEHRYTSRDKEAFFRSNETLAGDLRWSVSKVKRVKQELIDNGLITIEKEHYRFQNGKQSKSYYTKYKIM